MSKEINYNSSHVESEKIKQIVENKLKLICRETGNGSIIVHVNDKKVCDVIVSIKEKSK